MGAEGLWGPASGLCGSIGDVDNSAANRREFVEIADSADPVITVRHSERKPACDVAAYEENWRERLASVNSLEIVVHMRLVTRQKRELRGAQQVLRRIFHELGVAKALDERSGCRVRTQKGKEFHRGVKIFSFSLLGPFDFRLAPAAPLCGVINLRRYSHRPSSCVDDPGLDVV